jgi:hypothetical protein
MITITCDYCDDPISDVDAAELPPVPGIVPTRLRRHACADCRAVALAGMELFADEQAKTARAAAEALDGIIAEWIEENPRPRLAGADGMMPGARERVESEMRTGRAAAVRDALAGRLRVALTVALDAAGVETEAPTPER